MELRCPVCAAGLERQAGSLRCPEGHCFDLARQGYVNLLPVQQKHSLHPGDTREQVLARRRFLSAGFYQPLADTLCRVAVEAAPREQMLDAGCGEGYYSARVAQAVGLPLLGLDISKEAVRCAAASYKSAQWVCGTAAHLPVADGSIGLLMSLFAVTVPAEFRRVLRSDGSFLQVLAAEDHLLALKRIIYPELHEKPKETCGELPGFRLAQSVPVRFSFTVAGEEVRDLLYMTPHVYRITAQGLERLKNTARLTDTASCVINRYIPA